MSYILDVIDDKIPLSYEYINPKVNYEYLIPQLSINKLDFLSKYYNIQTILGSNMDSNLIDSEIIIRCILYDGEYPYGYFDLNRITSENIENNFEFSLKTTKLYNNNDEIELVSETGSDTNYIKRLDLSATPNLNNEFDVGLEQQGVLINEKIPSGFFKENLTFKIAVLIKDTEVDGNRVYRDTNNNSTTIKLLHNQPDLDNYSIVSILKGDTFINLFKSLSPIMYSEFLVDSVTSNALLTKVPLIFSNYFNNTINYTNFYEVFNKYLNVLLGNLNILEENTRIDFRFYNSYGPCKYYSIDKVNINFEFNIKLVGNYSLELDSNIKNSIINNIENFNETNSTVTISKLFTEIQNTYDEIEYIEFVGINNYNINNEDLEYIPYKKQKIELLAPTPLTHNPATMSKEHLINFVPEFINIPYNKNYEVTDAGVMKFNPSIIINYIQESF
jgi:hypothetical protein